MAGGIGGRVGLQVLVVGGRAAGWLELRPSLEGKQWARTGRALPKTAGGLELQAGQRLGRTYKVLSRDMEINEHYILITVLISKECVVWTLL